MGTRLTPRRVARLTVVFALLVTAPLRANAQSSGCRIPRGRLTARVLVEPSGAAPFELFLRTAESTVDVVAARESHVTVHTPITFVARARDLELRTTRTVAGLGLVLAVGTGESVTRLRCVDGRIVGTLGPEGGVEIRGVSLAADALVGDRRSFGSWSIPATTRASRCRVVSRRVTIREAPGAGAGVELRVSRFNSVQCTRIASRGAWTEIDIRWQNGTRLHGWVPRNAVESSRFPGNVRSGGQETESTGFSCGGLHRYCGPATVAATTRVFASPGVGVWGVFAAEAVVQIDVSTGDTWARVTGVEELPTVLGHAWIRVSALRIP